jgi:DNA-directed RNA polymerase specialized sigma subunit
MLTDNLIINYKKTKDKKILSEILQKYKPLIGSTANRYSTSMIPRHILEGEAKLLLAQAIETFDPHSGHFASHVANYMKGMNRVVNNASPLYIPQDRASKYSLFNNTRDDLERQLKRPPTHDEMADQLKWSTGDVNRMVIETGKTLIVGDEIQDSLKDSFLNKGNLLEFVYNKLNQNEKLVLEHSFGLHGKMELSTNADIATKIGVSQTMVRKMKDKIIKAIEEYR